MGKRLGSGIVDNFGNPQLTTPAAPVLATFSRENVLGLACLVGLGSAGRGRVNGVGWWDVSDDRTFHSGSEGSQQMPEDVWQVSGDSPVEARRRSVAVRAGRLLVVAAALATLGAGGVASASTGVHQTTTPAQVGAHSVSIGNVAPHDCPLHAQRSAAVTNENG